MNDELKRIRKEKVKSQLSFLSRIFLDKLKNIAANVSEGRQCPDRERKFYLLRNAVPSFYVYHDRLKFTMWAHYSFIMSILITKTRLQYTRVQYSNLLQ
jgi:hypothetical protein